MFPIQFILLLLLVSLPAQLQLNAQQERVNFSMGEIPTWLLISTFFTTQIFLVIFVWNRTRFAVRQLHEPSSSSAAITHRTDWLFAGVRVAALVITGIYLFATPLPVAVLNWYEGTRILRHIPILPETLFLLPALVAWLGIWIAAYHIEEANHERSLPYRLARHAPVHSMPTLGQFLGMQARHNFFPYLLILVSGFFERAGNFFSRWSPAAPGISSILGAIALVTLLPFLLVRVWSTTALTGPLRARLDRVAAMYRLRFRNILIWRTHNLVINAAIVGWIPRGRFFLMTDSLLESFTDDQLEAVFAHEVGHGVRWHIPWFAAILITAWAFATAFGTLGTHLHLPWIPADIVALALGVVAFGGVVGGGLYLVAPRFEHQADWFAATHMGKMIEEAPLPSRPAAAGTTVAASESAAPSAGNILSAESVSLTQYLAGQYPHSADPMSALPAAHGPTAVAQSVPTPTQAGAEVFISALDSLMESAHRDRKRRDLMHPSVDDRVTLLRNLALHPLEEKKFNRSIARTKLLIAGFLLVGITAVGLAATLPPPAASPGSSTQPASTSTAPASQTRPATAASTPVPPPP